MFVYAKSKNIYVHINNVLIYIYVRVCVCVFLEIFMIDFAICVWGCLLHQPEQLLTTDSVCLIVGQTPPLILCDIFLLSAG